MPAVNENEIELAYEAAVRAHGESEGLTMMVTTLMESLISEQSAYSKSAQRRATRAEEALARILGTDA